MEPWPLVSCCDRHDRVSSCVARYRYSALRPGLPPFPLLPASRAAYFSSCIVTSCHRFLFLSPDGCSLFRRCGASLTCLDLSDQVVHYPSRATVSLLAAQAYQLRSFLVRMRRRYVQEQKHPITTRR